MKKLLMLCILCFVFSFSTNVLAIDSCTTNELDRLKELANNVKFQKDYEMEIDDENKSLYLEYKLKIVNFNPDLKISFKMDDYPDTESIELTSTDELDSAFSEGSKINFKIYAYTNNLCTKRLLKTVTVNFPTYNDYYYFNKDKCQANPDFKYCQEFYDVDDIEFSEIDEQFNSYIKDKNPNIILSNNNIYLYIGAGAIIFVIITLLIIKIVISKRRKDDI